MQCNFDVVNRDGMLQHPFSCIFYIYLNANVQNLFQNKNMVCFQNKERNLISMSDNQ